MVFSFDSPWDEGEAAANEIKFLNRKSASCLKKYIIINETTKVRFMAFLKGHDI